MSEGRDDSWFLGIDLGTSSCKSVVTDVHARVLGFGSCDYGENVTETQKREQDPNNLVNAMVVSVRQAIAESGVRSEAVQSLSIGGAYHSLIAIDRKGEPLTGLLTWLDDRPTMQARAVRETLNPQEIYEQTGCPVHAMYPIYKVMWLREKKPEIFKRAWRFVSGKEFVLSRLTGEYLLDFGIAAGTGMLNVQNLEWNPLSLELAGITTEQLSPLYNPRHVVRNLKQDLAARMGIPPNAALVLGSADAVNSSLGAGAVSRGYATCMIGTSGALRIISPQPMLDSLARTWCYAIDPGHWLVGGAINNAGLALSWLRGVINRVNTYHSGGQQLSYQDIIGLATQVSTGADGLICLPFFAGERSPYWNMQARGVFFGLTLDHDLRHLARAVLEGVAFRLRSVRDVLIDQGALIEQIRASGGFTHSQLWPQIIASALNHQILILRWGETSCLGAAFWALMGAGAIHSFEDIYPMVEVSHIYNPIPKEAHIYNQLFEIYMNLYLKLGDSFNDLVSVDYSPTI